MGAIIEEKDRKIIPRWRDSRVTITTGELKWADNSGSLRTVNADLLSDRLGDWRVNRSLSYASDLLAAAFIVGCEREASDAARFILSDEIDAPKVARELATRVLNPGVENRNDSVNDLVLPDAPQIYRKIHTIRIRLKDEPRNAILWVDLALQYTILGVRDKALRAIKIALYLGPTNRFVLRSAARFLIHQDEFGWAHYILRNAPNVRSDPWLLAAEIASASAAGRTSRLIRPARTLLDHFSKAPEHTTELASALATLELTSGNDRGARKLFRQALIQPTENSVAQAVWASKQMVSQGAIDRSLLTPRTYEARALQSYKSGEWREALDESKDWLCDQPFSVRPAQLSSFLAAVAFEDYETSLKLIDIGLRANPLDQVLLFNQVFAAASLNDTVRAKHLLEPLKRLDISNHLKAVLWANEGLLQYRLGFPDVGASFYRKALDSVTGSGRFQRKTRALVLLYYAREEILSRSPNAHTIMDLARIESEGLTEPDLKLTMEHVQSVQERVERER
jgi:tetratricopeptide (TPR) repeat protein